MASVPYMDDEDDDLVHYATTLNYNTPGVENGDNFTLNSLPGNISDFASSSQFSQQQIVQDLADSSQEFFNGWNNHMQAELGATPPPPQLPAHLKPIADRFFASINMPDAGYSELLMWKLDQIQRKAGCTLDAAKELVKFASRLQMQDSLHPMTVSQLDSVPPTKLSLGCPILDTLFGGGIPVNAGIVEVVGEAGSGKSQFLMQLMLQSLLPVEYGGLDGMAVIITTEHFSRKRWNQLAAHYRARYPHVFIYENTATSRVHRLQCNTIDELLQMFDEPGQLMALLKEANIKLVVIDSIAALFRGQDEEWIETEVIEDGRVYHTRILARPHDKRAVEATTKLFVLAQYMKAISDIYKVPFIVANQVYDYGDFSWNSRLRVNESFETSGRYVLPTLGCSWSQCLNMRIVLRRSPRQVSVTELAPDDTPTKRRKIDEGNYVQEEIQEPPNPSSTVLRRMSIALCSWLPDETALFYIDNSGLHGIVEDDCE